MQVDQNHTDAGEAQLQRIEPRLRDDLLEMSYQIDAYIDGAHRLANDPPGGLPDITVIRLLEEAQRQLYSMREQIQAPETRSGDARIDPTANRKAGQL